MNDDNIDKNWISALEDTHDAVRAFARVEIAALARRSIYRLRRVKASGIYGDDLGHKSLWDEWSFEVNNGPHDLLDDAWSATLTPILSKIVEEIPSHVARLISVYAIWELDEREGSSEIGMIWLDGIFELLRVQLSKEALNI